MLSLLLDEHLSPVIAEQLRASHPELLIFSLQEWHDGAYLGASDATLLAAAYREGLTLITRDISTISPLLLVLQPHFFREGDGDASDGSGCVGPVLGGGAASGTNAGVCPVSLAARSAPG